MKLYLAASKAALPGAPNSAQKMSYRPLGDRRGGGVGSGRWDDCGKAMSYRPVGKGGQEYVRVKWVGGLEGRGE